LGLFPLRPGKCHNECDPWRLFGNPSNTDTHRFEIADIPNGGISNFFSQLITSFGYTAEQSLLYGTPGGAVEVITLIVGGWLGDRIGNRILVASFGMVASIIGMVLIVGLPLDNNKGRLGGYYMTQASAMPFVAFLSLISSNIAGYTKVWPCHVRFTPMSHTLTTPCLHVENDRCSNLPHRVRETDLYTP